MDPFTRYTMGKELDKEREVTQRSGAIYLLAGHTGTMLLALGLWQHGAIGWPLLVGVTLVPFLAIRLLSWGTES